LILAGKVEHAIALRHTRLFRCRSPQILVLL
jgi:hypothetical protein